MHRSILALLVFAPTPALAEAPAFPPAETAAIYRRVGPARA